VTPEEHPWEPEVWIDEGLVREAAAGAVARGTGLPRAAASGRPAKVPAELAGELERAVGAKQAAKLGERLANARRAFERERYQDARQLLLPVVQEAPEVAAVRELLGLTLYRLERWKAAAAELETYARLSGSVDQLPVLADCYRALRRYKKVDELWAELRAVSPPGPIMAEGRIVAAGALADQGDLKGAIGVLERSTAAPKKIREHHLRQWYVLADLYDRAGETPRSRALFERIRAVDPTFADVAARLRQLGRQH
jgi:tetratricopeptide (TPR) repeat protein